MDLRHASGDRSCFVHAGTHKTGTTAIQRFLAGNRERLALAGLYYPVSAVWSAQLPGHHNVAFELNGSPRFDPAGGTLADVLAELARVRPRNACVSSESFGFLHVQDDALTALRDRIAAAGYHPRIVLYVRAQDEYAESLYAELVKHGLLVSFPEFLEAVLGHGVVRHDRGWTFRFDYTKLADRFASVFGADAVIVRGYRDRGSPDSLVRDFLGALGVVPFVSAAGGAEPAVYDNLRLTTGGVITWLFRNVGASLGDDRIVAAGAELVARDPQAAGEPFRPLAPRTRARVAARFADDNARLARRWPAATIDRRQPAEFEPERARGARALFERAEALRRTFVSDARPLRSGALGG